jgi:hypothetical protein
MEESNEGVLSSSDGDRRHQMQLSGIFDINQTLSNGSTNDNAAADISPADRKAGGYEFINLKKEGLEVRKNYLAQMQEL